MTYAMTAEDLFKSLKQMPTAERQKFFGILSMNVFRDEDMSHEQLFGHLAEDEFTAAQAAEYLEVSMSTFRRYIAIGRLSQSSTVGRNQLFKVAELKALKKALKTAKG
jgi:excisionase family DNA binding protein